MTIKRQLYFINKGLDLRDIFVYNLIKFLPYPITISDIVKSSPLVGIKERQMRVIIKRLALANLFATHHNKYGLFFIFPFATPATFRRRKTFMPCKISPEKALFPGKISPGKPLYKYNINNKKTSYYKRHNDDDREHFIYAKDNSKSQTRYLRTIKELFKNAFPSKNNYIKSPIPKDFNISLLIEKVKQSEFLQEREFSSLEWCIKNYRAIINDCYKEYKQKPAPPPPPKPDFTQREYSKEECNTLFDDLDDVDI